MIHITEPILQRPGTCHIKEPILQSTRASHITKPIVQGTRTTHVLQVITKERIEHISTSSREHVFKIKTIKTFHQIQQTLNMATFKIDF